MSRFWKSVASFYDALVAPSFGAPGFNARRRTWEEPPAPEDLSGVYVAVSGANSGIGLATSLMLAERGAHVQMLCRSQERGQDAREQLIDQTGNERVELHILDVADLDSVTTFCDHYLNSDRPLHALVHNAGALLDRRVETEQGLETTYACHVVGPFVATHRLMPKLVASASPQRNSRVVWVSSGGMYTQRLDLRWIERGPDPFDGVVQYAQCKRAQVILAGEFARRFSGEPIAFSSMHPGWVETPGVSKSLPGFEKVTRPILRTPEQGADTVVWLAASPSSNDAAGEFYLDRKPRRKQIPLRDTEPSEDEVERLWARLEELTSQKAEGE